MKAIGGKLGYKFDSWETVNIAKNIGNAAKVVGPVISALGFLFDVKETIDEAERNERIAREQVKYRQSFVDVANDLEKQYVEHTNGIFAVYKSITDEIAGNRTKVQQMIADHDSMGKELAALKSNLTGIQTAIF